MPVTDEEVTWAYRIFLGREPENESVVRAHVVNHSDVRSMARAFAACHEFNSRALLPSTTTADKHFTVEVNCSTTELTIMIERIVNAWKWFGETEPYWSVLTNDAFKAANIAGHLDAFYESGRRDISRLVVALCRNQVDEKAIKNVIDFGCGVGRLTLALASRFPHVTSID